MRWHRPEHLFLLTLMASCLNGQPAVVQVDFSQFYHQDGSPRIEIYLGIDYSYLNFQLSGNAAVARAAAVVLVKQRGQIIAFREFDLLERVVSGHTLEGRAAKVATFDLPPGEYNVQVVAEDGNSLNYDSTHVITVTGDYYGGFFASDLQLAEFIQRPSTRSEFYKTGLMVIPNASREYSGSSAMLWYLMEIYGVTPLDTVWIRSRIIHGADTVRHLIAQDIAAPATSFIHRGALKLSHLPAGEYILDVEAAINGQHVSRKRSFRITVADPEQGRNFGDLDLTQLYGLANLLAVTHAEFDIHRFRARDIAGKRDMITAPAGKIAQRTDRDTSDYVQALVDNQFLVEASDFGWRTGARVTPRGQVLLYNGQPDEITIFPATSTGREHQIWSYESAAGVNEQFVFVDRDGYGDYRLAHATITGWAHDPAWQRMIPWVPPPVAAVAQVPLAATESPDTTALTESTTLPADSVAVPDTASTATVDSTEIAATGTFIDSTSVADTLAAGQPADTLVTGPPADSLTTGQPADTLVTGQPADSLTAGQPVDSLSIPVESNPDSLLDSTSVTPE